MGEGITGTPNRYPAGLDFDYSVWSPGTRVDLVNVNWDNNYRDVVRFASKAKLNEYIDDKAGAGITVQNMTYAKPGKDIHLGIPYNRVNRYNYLRASNPLMPITGDIQKDFYYFILDCEFINPTTTRLRVQLDVWQTYVYDAKFGNCYVERGHAGVANSKKFDKFGRDYLTIPEGFDLGGEYRHIARRSVPLIVNNSISTSPLTDGDIVVVSTLDIERSGGTVEDPVLVTANGSKVNGMSSGADFYIFKSQVSFNSFMDSLATKPWVSQGIISVTYMPSLSRYTINGGADYVSGEKIQELITFPRENSLYVNWREQPDINDHIPARYQHVKQKFFTYPYMLIELTAWSGNAVVLKPEMWNNFDAQIQERASYMPPNQRVSLHPRGYNRTSGERVDNLWDLSDELIDAFGPDFAARTRNMGDDSSDYLDIAISINNFPSLPVVNNMAISYLATNSNQLAFQFKSADWTQQRALGMAGGQYDIATGAMHTAMNAAGTAGNADISQTANQNRTQVAQAIVGGASTAIGGAAMGGGAGLAVGALSAGAGVASAGIGAAANDEALSIRLNALGENTINENKQQQLVRDTNKGLADWAAKGDYSNAVDGINAKIQDAAMIQPSVGGQFGGESHNIGTNKLEFSVRWKLIDDAHIRKIGDIWLRYGYMVSAFMKLPETLMVMSKFTYWKVTETYLAGTSVPEAHKQVLRGILEKGVTVYANPDDIGMIDWADNVPLGGFSY
jgi:hypothetical protein